MSALKLIPVYSILLFHFQLFGQSVPTKEREPIRLLTLIHKSSKISLVVNGDKGFVKKLDEPQIIINAPCDHVENVITEFYEIKNISRFKHLRGNISTENNYYIMIYDEQRGNSNNEELNYTIPLRVLKEDIQISQWFNKLEKLTSLTKR